MPSPHITPASAVHAQTMAMQLQGQGQAPTAPNPMLGGPYGGLFGNFAAEGQPIPGMPNQAGPPPFGQQQQLQADMGGEARKNKRVMGFGSGVKEAGPKLLVGIWLGVEGGRP